MLALLSVWAGLFSLVIAVAMVVHRPAMTDLTMTLVLYFGAPGAMCGGGLVLWAYRKDHDDHPGVSAQRVQAKVAIALAVAAVVIAYELVISAQPIPRVE